MADMDCPNCDGTGYITDGSGEDILCPICDGTGVLFGDEDPGGATSDAGG